MAGVIVLIVVTSSIGIINPLLIQAVFNKALFVPGGPDLHLLGDRPRNLHPLQHLQVDLPGRRNHA